MYKLTPRMLKGFERNLKKYHALFEGGRCEGIQQEELLVKGIKTCATAQVVWQGKGHDDNPDIVITSKNVTHPFRISSGEEQKKGIKISGYRLGTHNGNFTSISRYINSRDANIICITYRKVNDKAGLKHIYRLCYLDVSKLKGITSTGWAQPRSSRTQTNTHGVKFSVTPSMSWQLWWTVPKNLFESESEIVITKWHSKSAKIKHFIYSTINRILRKNV